MRQMNISDKKCGRSDFMAVSAAAVTAKLVALTPSDWEWADCGFSVVAALSDPCYFNCHQGLCTAFWDW